MSLTIPAVQEVQDYVNVQLDCGRDRALLDSLSVINGIETFPSQRLDEFAVFRDSSRVDMARMTLWKMATRTRF